MSGVRALLTFLGRLHEAHPHVGQAGTFCFWDREVPCTVVRVVSRRVIVVRLGGGQEIRVSRRRRADGSVTWKRVGTRTRQRGFAVKLKG